MSAIMGGLSKRAPRIVVVSLVASLIGAWTSAPAWLFNALAIVVGALALALWTARSRQFKPKEDLGFDRNRDLIAYELDGKWTPRGSYLLWFAGFLTIFLTGFQSPYAKLALASLALAVAWSLANAHYPSDRGSD